MIVSRILAVIAAVLLVGAVALAMLGPPDVPLGELLLKLDHQSLKQVHTWLAGHAGEWSWSHIAAPLMLRPAWLVPASLGIIAAGGAFSLSNRKPARRSPRRSQ